LYRSASTATIFGYHPEELLGRNCLEFIHPEDRDHSRRALRDALTNRPGPCQWDARVRCKDGHYSWIESTASNFLLEPEVQAIVIHQRNIDARKAVEAERLQQSEQLAKSNLRLEEFAYTAAHDLREPLRTIAVYTEILVRQIKPDTKSTQTAKFIIDGATRMSALVDDLLSFASTGVHEPPRWVDLQHAVAEATLNLQPVIEASGAIVTVEKLPIVRSNEIHLVRLFQNLISNAVKYRGENPATIHISAEQQGSEWVISIVDNGIGIAPEHQARVFMPFVRLADRNIPGTGLGLAACKNIVESLGGTIWVKSEPGAGSTFCFTLAAVEAAILIPQVSREMFQVRGA